MATKFLQTIRTLPVLKLLLQIPVVWSGSKSRTGAFFFLSQCFLMGRERAWNPGFQPPSSFMLAFWTTFGTLALASVAPFPVYKIRILAELHFLILQRILTEGTGFS